MKNILTGMFLFALYKTIGIPEHYENIAKKRKAICDKCPLKKGNFCSSKYAVELFPSDRKLHSIIRVKKNHRKLPKSLIAVDGKMYKRGCGCYLPFKQLSDSICPMRKWNHLKPNSNVEM